MSDFKLETIGGYDFFGCTSAFQKAIRRGDEDQAMFWAIELYSSNYANYLWKRMVIMASEDVGLGDPDVVTRILSLKASYNYLRNEKNTHNAERLPFIQAVITLVRAKKSRFIDMAYAVYWRRWQDEKQEIPDYAWDQHTRRGKKMGRGDVYFYDESAKINNANLVDKEEEFLAIEKEYSKIVDSKRNWSSTDPDPLPRDDNDQLPDMQTKMF